MIVWEYHLDGSVAARVRHPDDDAPYLGMPVCMVGRTGKPAPAENFIVCHIDVEAKSLDLEYAQ